MFEYVLTAFGAISSVLHTSEGVIILLHSSFPIVTFAERHSLYCVQAGSDTYALWLANIAGAYFLKNPLGIARNSCTL